MNIKVYYLKLLIKKKLQNPENKQEKKDILQNLYNLFKGREIVVSKQNI